MIITTVAICIVAAIHLWFMVFEMFLWTTPLARKTFNMSEQLAQDSRVLALNQGLLNGLLAAGLGMSLFVDPGAAYVLQVFLLSSIVIAGIVGAISSKWFILAIQAAPAAAALLLIHL